MRWIRNCLYILGFLILLIVFKIWIKPVLIQTHWYIWFYERVYFVCLQSLKSIFLSPVFYIAVGFILMLEHLFPAKRNQKILSVGFAQDSIWFLLDACFQATLITALSTYWRVIYKEHFSFLTIHMIQQWPYWIRLIIGILVADFSGWFHHYLRHKVSWMWPFHALHHSQKELNIFTDVRYHIFEYLITAVTNVFFISMFTMDPYSVVYYTLFHSWYTKMCHANIKSDFGPLKYLLITPQSHRVHHSVELRHHDKNLGILLSIWDYIFGTQYRKYDEYPETGINDEHFPHETAVTGFHLLINPIKQHLYPFQAIGRNWKNRNKRPSS